MYFLSYNNVWKSAMLKSSMKFGERNQGNHENKYS